MSISATNIAFDAALPDPIAKLVLIGLADWADDSNIARIDFPELAAFAGLTEPMTDKIVSRLIGYGALYPVDRAGGRYVLIQAPKIVARKSA